MILNINGHNLFVEDLGLKNNEAIVFLNGVMTTTSSWYELSDWFVKNGYRVILHDFKGQLKSDKPQGPYTFKEHAEDTIEILKKLGVKKAHFIGTSYGGEVGLKIGILFPEYVKSISVIDSVSELDQTLKNEINHWTELCKNNDGYQFFWGMAGGIYSNAYIQKNKAFLEKRAYATKHMDKSYFEGQITLYETFMNDVTMTEELKCIKAPSLIVCGELDTLKPPKFSKIIADHIMNSEYIVIPDAGHVVIFEKPKELLTLLIGFIKKNKIKV
ncbi:MAG: alpha/beta hydrolase [Acholeplasmataceae bacterium]|nr:alpha/beta hydrolase [Acholeplasmataceae bacterium]